MSRKCLQECYFNSWKFKARTFDFECFSWNVLNKPNWFVVNAELFFFNLFIFFTLLWWTQVVWFVGKNVSSVCAIWLKRALKELLVCFSQSIHTLSILQKRKKMEKIIIKKNHKRYNPLQLLLYILNFICKNQVVLYQWDSTKQNNTNIIK